MKTFSILAVASGALAFLVVTLMPQPADAGWRRKAWRPGYAPGARVYVSPRRGYFAPRRTACRRGCAYPYAYYPYWRTRYFRGWR